MLRRGVEKVTKKRENFGRWAKGSKGVESGSAFVTIGALLGIKLIRRHEKNVVALNANLVKAICLGGSWNARFWRVFDDWTGRDGHAESLPREWGRKADCIPVEEVGILAEQR
jgi:hypothetical protein